MKRHPIAATLALAALAGPAAAQRVAIDPPAAAYGQPVSVDILEMSSPIYLPATRYAFGGSTLYIDYEYSARLQGTTMGFGPAAPAMGPSAIALGELPPGNYNVQVRLIDVDRPNAASAIVEGAFSVAPPEGWGIRTVPQEPLAFSAAKAVLRSAAYFDPNSMRAQVSGSVVRVDFTYKDDSPMWSVTPPGMVTMATMPLPALPPGNYHLEGWGRAASGGNAEKFFATDFTVDSSVPVVEYYSAKLDHYFISAGVDEIALLDRGGNGDWERTGQSMLGWMRVSDAPPGAVPVCRFYAAGPNSHFYTANASECESLKALELDQRAQAAAKGQPFLGWAFETIAFWAVPAQNGQCFSGLRPVYRVYNNRAQQMDSNHRFMVDEAQHTAMAGWVDEGVAFCAGSAS